MNEYRYRDSGQLIREDEFRRAVENVSLPQVLSQYEFDRFRIDPVLQSPQPIVTEYQSVQRDGVIGDGNGKWFQKWKVVDWTQEQIAAHNKAKVPQFVTMRQARLALLQAGLLDDVAGIIAAMPSPQKECAQIEWEYSQQVERHRPLVQALAPALGLTEAQTDELFITASTL